MPSHILIKLIKTKHKERILRMAREKQQVTYKWNSIYLTADLSAETLQARREWQDIFKVLKGKILQPRLLFPSRILFKIDGVKKLFRQENVRKNQYHQPNFTANVKGTYIVKKYKRIKKIYKNQPQNIKKMAIEAYISIITLNVNGLNAPTKRHSIYMYPSWLNGYIYILSTRNLSDLKTHIDWKWEDRKIYSMQMEIERKLE